MTHNRQLALIRKLCGLGLPAQTLAPSLLPALRELIPSHSAAVFWVDARYEMTGLYAERLLPPEAMARYYENHYQHTVTGFPTAFAARARASDPVSARKLTKTEQATDYFRDVLARLDAYQILYGVLRDGALPIGQISFYRGARDAEFGRRDQSVLRGLLRYLAAGLRPQPLSPVAPAQSEIVEEWLGLVEQDGRIVSGPTDWSRLVRLLAMGEVAPRTARAEERVVSEFLRAIIAQMDGADRPGGQHVDLQRRSPWGHFRIRGYRLPDAEGQRRSLVGLVIGRKEPLALALARGTGASALSPQQREVALLLAEGNSNQEIARALDLTLNTANYHVKQVFARLQVHHRDDVADVLLHLAQNGVMANRRAMAGQA
ncbi:MAG: helix-turn-helix transcriptional regulator [Burkholderiales bacterium]